MSGITLFGCPVTNDYLQLLKKAAGYNPADDVGIVKIVATDDKKVTVHWDDGTTSELVNVSAAASSFDDLTDTPASKSGQALKGLRVDSAEATLEYVEIATAGHTHSWSEVDKSGSVLSDIGDVPAYTANKVLGVDSSGTTLQWVSNAGSTAGVTNWVDLTETPSSIIANQFVRGSADGSSLEFGDLWYDFYVNYSTGSDSNDGSSGSPFKTLQHAIGAVPEGASGGIWLQSDVTVTAATSLYFKNICIGQDYGAGHTITLDGGCFYLNKSSVTFGHVTFEMTNPANDCLFYSYGDSTVYLGGYYGVIINFHNASNSQYIFKINYGTFPKRIGPPLLLASFVRLDCNVSDSAGATCYAYTSTTNNWGQAWLIENPKDCSFDSLFNQNIPVLENTSHTHNWTDLGQTPSSLSGNAYKLIAVNSAAASLVFIDREDVWEGTMYTKKVDYNTDGQPLYEGWAAPGSSTSDAVWRIKKIEYDSNGRVTGEVWADGNTNFDNTWDTKSAISTWS